jgi:MoxR-like ATPase
MDQTVNKEQIEIAQNKLNKLKEELKKEITGQDKITNSILISLVSGGHVLLEGMPGLAKTLLAKSIAATIELPFKRIQFTPDLLPSDLIGTNIFNPKTISFETRKGPIFTGVLLADEINRAPAKVQSALLQCMEEKIVTIGDTTFPLDLPFLVLATENPIDQEGTYQLPEAQMDRFLMKIQVGYPSEQEEIKILEQHGTSNRKNSIEKVLTKSELNEISKLAEQIYIDPKLKEYIVKLSRCTRPDTTSIDEIKPYIKHGVSPRASLAILKTSKANALMEGRNFVVPEDIRANIFEIMRHRMILNFEAISEDISVESLIKTVVEITPLP